MSGTMARVALGVLAGLLLPGCANLAPRQSMPPVDWLANMPGNRETSRNESYGTGKARSLRPLADVPRLTFAGIRQNDQPTLLWSVARPESSHPQNQVPLISPDGRWLVLYGKREIILFDLSTHRVVATTDRPDNVVRLFFDQSKPRLIGLLNIPDSQSYEAKTGRGTLGFWALPSLEFSQRPLLPVPGGATNAVLTHRQDRMLVMGIDGLIRVFDIASGRQTSEFTGHRQDPNGPHYWGGMAVTHDDRIVSSSIGGPNLSGVLQRWRLDDGQKIPTGPEGRDRERFGGDVMSYTQDDRFVFNSGVGATLTLPENGHVLYRYNASANIDDIRSPLVAIHFSHFLKFGVIDVSTGQLLMVADQPGPGFPSMAWVCLSPDDRTVYAADVRDIKAYDFGSDRQRLPEYLRTGARSIKAIAISGHRAEALGWSSDNEGPEALEKWDLTTRSILPSTPLALESLRVHKHYEHEVPAPLRRWFWSSFSVKGKLYGIVGKDGEAEIFDLTSGELRVRLTTQPASARDPLDVFRTGFGRKAAASPDGRVLAIGQSAQYPVHPLTLWDLKTGKNIPQTESPSGAVYSLQYSSDGDRLITGGGYSELQVWTAAHPVPPGDDSRRAVFHAASDLARFGRFHPPRNLAKTRKNPAVLSLIHTLSPSEAGGPVKDLCTNADGKLLCAAHVTGLLTGWREDSTGAWRDFFNYKLPWEPACLALSPDGRFLAVAQVSREYAFYQFFDQSTDTEVVVFDLQTGEPRVVLSNVEARQLRFLNNRQLITAGTGLRIWTLPGF